MLRFGAMDGLNISGWLTSKTPQYPNHLNAKTVRSIAACRFFKAVICKHRSLILPPHILRRFHILHPEIDHQLSSMMR